jgi:hypothetical protein
MKLLREYIRSLLEQSGNTQTQPNLIDKLEISESPIHGSGIFARDFIPAHTDLGPAQIKRIDGGYDITTLGKYHNHSNNPTCYNNLLGDTRHLFSQHDLSPGEEITVNYRLQSDLEQPQSDWEQ